MEEHNYIVTITIYIEPYNLNIPMPDYRFPKIWF
jgi:hypothetical protein